MTNELMQAMDYLEYERGVSREKLIEMINAAVRASARKAIVAYENVDVDYDIETNSIRCFAKLMVVEEVLDSTIEISLEDARVHQKDAQIGDQITIEVTTDKFGRIAAQTAKQVIIQNLRAYQTENICDSYKDQLNQLISGTVKRVEMHEIIIDFNQVEGVMRTTERIPGEDFETGDHITALLTEVNSDPSKPTLVVSRKHPDFVLRLFEREVSEISEGTVIVKGIAREAGFRSKLAVYTEQPKVDPVGACVGVRGARVKTIVRELCGEKVDVIQWDPDIRVYVANALKPARLAQINVDEKRKQLTISVTEDQLSLTIGKKGQNARLATKLTGWRIEVNKIAAESINQEEEFAMRLQRAIDSLAGVPGIGAESATILVNNGFSTLDGILASEIGDLAVLEGIGPDRAEEIYNAAKAALA